MSEVQPSVKLVAYTPHPMMVIESAAANCYNSEPSSDGKIMRACYNSGHHSVLEFVDFVWHVEGVSRALSHQLVRSRLASFAQRSQRYCKEDDFGYIIPQSIKNSKDEYLYKCLMNLIQISYTTLLEHGIPAEDARFILPNACETILEIKMNLREFIHFCNTRLCVRAQWEIKQLCEMMKEEVLKTEPLFKEFLVPQCQVHAPYNFCTEQKCCGLSPRLKDVYNKVGEQTD